MERETSMLIALQSPLILGILQPGDDSFGARDVCLSGSGSGLFWFQGSGIRV